ncbi:hypothetical protein [Paenibacillus sp. Soil724D2]|uniref:hypothetical protein n=1 Tax=Paenibacillus sp. (strain Soil724D2) TaxID=1736392 RepID=UPI000714D76A|nr:hypothetical protein [Paenibacillus sp. Soil724D2]KRE50650.1 hypothetical protein ASG85_20580 [Paenibacillus sp. Soil724D2]
MLSSYKENIEINSTVIENEEDVALTHYQEEQNDEPTSIKEKTRDVNDQITSIVQSELAHLDLHFNNRANSGRTFVYRHFSLKNDPIWHKDFCNVRLHVYYGNNEQITTRVEFGFSQNDDFISKEQKEYLRKLMDSYARLHGLGIRNDKFYKINEVITGDYDSVISATSTQLVKLMQNMNYLLQTFKVGS